MSYCKRIRFSVDIATTFADRCNQVRQIRTRSALSVVRQPQRQDFHHLRSDILCYYQKVARLGVNNIYHQQHQRCWIATGNTESEEVNEPPTLTTETTTTTTTTSKRNQFVLVSANVQTKLHASIRRYNEIMEEMKSGKIVSHGMQQELSSLSEAYKLYQQHTALHDDEQSYINLMAEVQQQHPSAATNTAELAEENAEILEDCQTEIRRICNEKLQCEERLVNAILPKDIEDITCDAIIEIRAGTGGDEASLFAREIWDCYMKCIKTVSKQWKVDILTETITDLGGLKDGSLLISGNSISIEFESPNMIISSGNNNDNARNDLGGDRGPTKTSTEEIGPYGFFKFESGVHRVQRIPINATRIHTSACSIAVLPSMKEDTVDKNELLPMSELKIETMRAHGAGGQHINTTDSAVRITHIPTGIQAAIQDERSQHKNKEKALKLITARVRDLKRIEQEQQLGLQRSQLMGGGDRSERIRTYNYPQDRITDHRCKVSIQNISSLLSCQSHSLEDGLVISFLPYLKLMRREELLQQLEG
jgi:peptide chain release factor 1